MGMWPFRDSHAPSWFSGPRTDAPTDPSPPLRSPDCLHQRILTIYIFVLELTNIQKKILHMEPLDYLTGDITTLG